MSKKQKGINLNKHTAEFHCEDCDAELIVDFEERDEANKNEGQRQELAYWKAIVGNLDNEVYLETPAEMEVGRIIVNTLEEKFRKRLGELRK